MRDQRAQALSGVGGAARFIRRRWPFGGWFTFVLALAGLLLCVWLAKSACTWRVTLAEHTECRVRFYRWCSGDCVLDFYRDGVRFGGTTLNRGLFEHPWAVFPGPHGQSVVCFSWLDTTFAAFSVDLRRRSDATVPRILEEAVAGSDFPVRACTRAEVDFVADLITHADPDCWASHLYADKIPADLERDRCLSFLRLATTPDLWRDHSLHGAPPQILPVDSPWAFR